MTVIRVISASRFIYFVMVNGLSKLVVIRLFMITIILWLQIC